MIANDSGKPNIFLCLDEINIPFTIGRVDVSKLIGPISNLLRSESFNFICSSMDLETYSSIESRFQRSVNVSKKC
jgi:hypothetical protein